MQFNSMSFAIFLPIIVCLYWVFPHKHRWILLLTASYYFYMSWNIKYVTIILFVTVVSYLCALLIEKQQKIKKKKIILVIALILFIGILIFFKYFNFIGKTLTDVSSIIGIPLHPITLKIILPIGISFYIFQTISYLIDVYKGDINAEHHFGYYAVFVSFFPLLIAGPIERAKNLIPQLKRKYIFEYNQAAYGLVLMAWGFFKKLVIADNLSIYVDIVYADLPSYRGLSMAIAVLFFTLQIYCDFSGYSDIAIGTAKLFGINLLTNFKSPYFSASIHEFWSRWHISLSTWFRDYVYIPLGGNRVGKVRHKVNLAVTFLISGLWHGANWTYIFWGGVHSGYQISETLLLKEKKKYNNKISWSVAVLITFLLVNAAWIFFRAETLSDALYIFRNFLYKVNSPMEYIKTAYMALGIDRFKLLNIFVSIIVLFIYDFISLKFNVIEIIRKQNIFIRWSVYYILLMMIIFLGNFGNSTFIYFQF